MSEHVVKILGAKFITHNVRQFLIEKPAGFSFIPGQATEISLNQDHWKKEGRPFTFTSLPEWPDLQFTIKIYDDHRGVTQQLGKAKPGAELIMRDIFGAIHYKGPGVFIAGGAGITPFIAIFRDLFKKKKLDGNSLIFSNKTTGDVILREELNTMLSPNFINVFTRNGVPGMKERRIDKDFLVENIKDTKRHFYVCGPDKFVKEITGHLISLGADTDAVVLEE